MTYELTAPRDWLGEYEGTAEGNQVKVTISENPEYGKPGGQYPYLIELTGSPDLDHFFPIGCTAAYSPTQGPRTLRASIGTGGWARSFALSMRSGLNIGATKPHDLIGLTTLYSDSHECRAVEIDLVRTSPPVCGDGIAEWTQGRYTGFLATGDSEESMSMAVEFDPAAVKRNDMPFVSYTIGGFEHVSASHSWSGRASAKRWTGTIRMGHCHAPKPNDKLIRQRDYDHFCVTWCLPSADLMKVEQFGGHYYRHSEHTEPDGEFHLSLEGSA